MKIDQKKLQRFLERINEEAKKEFGEFEDGGALIEVEVTDRTRFERSHYIPILYDHKAVTDEDRRQIENGVFLNLSLAYHAIETWQKLRSIRESWKIKTEGATDGK